MELINYFLDRYKNIKVKDLELKEFFCLLIKEEINKNIEIERKDIKKNGYCLIIKTKPIIKNEIILNKGKLLEKLKLFNIKDIK